MPETTELAINTAQVIDSSKVSDHHAIILTNNQPTVAQLEEEAKSGTPISLMDLDIKSN
ncbi:hypothetical protein ACOAOT_13735 [Lacrimispora sp. AGF001]|uniref:hypothetical protein n=1 Tax=Lacrimispora sp. AGF001 TaxID=3401631 RepID=UPI003B42DF90